MAIPRLDDIETDVTDLETVTAVQTWQDVFGSRALGVEYTNTTNQPIMVYITALTANNVLAGLNVTVGGLQLGPTSSSPNAQTQVTFIVPVGTTYQVNINSSVPVLTHWAELRV